MKNAIFIVILFIFVNGFSQQKSLEIINKKTGKSLLFKENDRIKIRTLKGKKIVGFLHLSDNSTVKIDNKTVLVDSLLSIKMQPKGQGVLKTIVLATGLSFIGSSIISAFSGNESSLFLFSIGTGVTVSAGLIEGWNSNYSNRNWNFSIIEK